VKVDDKNYIFIPNREPVKYTPDSEEILKTFPVNESKTLGDLVSFAQVQKNTSAKNIVKTPDSVWCANLLNFINPNITKTDVVPTLTVNNPTLCFLVFLIIATFGYVVYIVITHFSKEKNPTHNPNQNQNTLPPPDGGEGNGNLPPFGRDGNLPPLGRDGNLPPFGRDGNIHFCNPKTTISTAQK